MSGNLLKNVFFGVVLSCTSWSATYEKVAEKKLFNGEVVKEFKFQNGLKLLLVSRHQAPVLTYQVWFDVGSLNEKMDQKLNRTGLAHLFEHMMFRGTKKYPDGKFDELTSRLGSDKQNATTYYYRTNYFESVPSYQLEKIMELESDRMANLILDGELLEKEKGAVVGEFRRAMDNPSRLAWDELMRLVYTESPFRFTVLGTEEEIKGFSLEDAQYFYKTFYAPNNCTIIVVGDAKEENLLPLVEKYYGSMKPQEIPKLTLKEEPPQTKERKWEGKHAQATSEILLMAYRIPPVTELDIIPLSLISSHLSNGMESRLRKALVDTGIAVGASAGISNRPDLFEVSVSLSEKHSAEEAIRIIDREVALLHQSKISKNDFERALNQELLSVYGSIGNNNALANLFGEYLMISGNYLRGLEVLEGYKKLDSGDLQKIAKKYFKKENRSIVIVRPTRKGKVS
ncbi:MAG: insulinase family protein [Proteobacteria bacterium]|nr:insulinase family protein [Pseudomonadota bacterium]